MQYSKGNDKRYSCLQEYLQKDIFDLVKKPGVLAAILSIGEINGACLTEALKWGAGPTVWVDPDMTERFGFFWGEKYNTQLNIAGFLVDAYKEDRDWVQTTCGRVRLLGITILHELVHWADLRDGVARPDQKNPEKEVGNIFEIKAFGRIVELVNKPDPPKVLVNPAPL
jgi:Metallopeptidase toxin 3